ncbi:MAG: hypothetical protein ABIY63_10120, partial [Fibrobacteria bacterium]
MKSKSLSRVGRKSPQTASRRKKLPWALGLIFLSSAVAVSAAADSAAGGEDLQLSLSDLLDIKVVTASKS